MWLDWFPCWATLILWFKYNLILMAYNQCITFDLVTAKSFTPFIIFHKKGPLVWPCYICILIQSELVYCYTILSSLSVLTFIPQTFWIMFDSKENKTQNENTWKTMEQDSEGATSVADYCWITPAHPISLVCSWLRTTLKMMPLTCPHNHTLSMGLYKLGKRKLLALSFWLYWALYRWWKINVCLSVRQSRRLQSDTKLD